MNRDLTIEGQRLLDTILNYQSITDPQVQEDIPPNIPRKNKLQVENDRLVMEIMKMIVNSLMVIEDCEEILKQLTTAEGYINSDAKVAKTLHYNNITRLQRVLRGLTAFEEDRDQDLMRNLSSYLSKIKIK